MSILATVQNHVLGIKNFNEVYPECQPFSTDWEEIGCYLGITKATVSIIKVDNNGAQKRLSGFIAAWLKRDGVKQPLPTWRMLCKAIDRVDSTSAEEIARKHPCHCDKCTPVSPCDVLKRHFTQLLGVITVPDKLANDLSMSDLISSAVTTRVLTSPSLDQYHKASILMNEIFKSLSVFNEPERFQTFCDVLKRQGDPDLVRIANIMLQELDGTTTGTEDVDQVPTSTTLARRTLKHSKPIKKDVLRVYRSEICTRLNISPETFMSFAAMLYSHGIIDQQTKSSVCQTGGRRGASILLDHTEMKVEQNPKVLNMVLEVMEREETLRYIVEKIKGESDSEDEKIVKDNNNDNDRNEYMNGDHDYMKKGKDQNITNNKWWIALGVLLVGIIVIAGCCGLKVVYEVRIFLSSNKCFYKHMSHMRLQSSVVNNTTESLVTEDGKANRSSYHAQTTKMDGGLIPENEDLLIPLKTVSEVILFCRHLGLPYEDCDTIKTENSNNLGIQKFSLMKKWRQKKERTWKEFIIPFALLDNCVKAKELATEYSVYFDAKLKDDQIVLDRCTDINNRDKTI